MHKVLVLTIIVFCLVSWSCPYLPLDSEINLTLAVSGAGTVFPAAPLAVALHTDIPINAAPATGSRFVKWIVLEGIGVVIADANAAQTTVRLTAGKAVIQAGFEYIP